MAIQNRKKSVKVLVTGTKVVSAEYTVRKPRLAAQLFQQEHGVKAAEVDGRAVIGHCASSGRIILEGDAFQWTGGPDNVLHLLKEINR